MDPIIVTVAPHAPPPVLAAHPDLPRTPARVAEEVIRAREAGAAIAHLHVLDGDGQPTSDLAAFEETVSLIRKACDILIEGSTGGLGERSAEERSVSLNSDIELASLNAGSVNFEDNVYVNSPRDIDYWVRRMHERSIKPTIIVFEAGMIATAASYAEKGLIASPMFFNLVLGLRGAMPATARNALFATESLPPESVWELTGAGGRDLDAALWAVALGGHVRAGFEDDVFYRNGERAETNAALIERIARIAREAERPPATPAEARQMLGL